MRELALLATGALRLGSKLKAACPNSYHHGNRLSPRLKLPVLPPRSACLLAMLSLALVAWPALGSISANSVTLAWDASPSTNVVGYNVYYGVASQAYSNLVSVGNATNAVIDGLVPGTTYYFAATAMDSTGLESEFSNEAVYTAPGQLGHVRMQLASNGQVQIDGTGQSGQTYELEATQDFRSWSVVNTVNVQTNGTFQMTDPAAAGYPSRFYRVHSAQLPIPVPQVLQP